MHLLHRDREVRFLPALHKSIRFRAQGEGLDDRCVRLIARRRLTVCRRHMLQLVKVVSPIIWDRAWIIQIGLVEFFYVRRIAAKEVRIELE